MDLTKTIVVRFPKKKRVSCTVDGFVIETDQPKEDGGDDSAPGPFSLFLASLATCAGAYVVAFCDARDLSVDGIELTQTCEFDSQGRLREVRLMLDLPEEFPLLYVGALRAAVASCKVKKVLAAPPNVSVDVRQARNHHHVA